MDREDAIHHAREDKSALIPYGMKAGDGLKNRANVPYLCEQKF